MLQRRGEVTRRRRHELSCVKHLVMMVGSRSEMVVVMRGSSHSCLASVMVMAVVQINLGLRRRLMLVR